MTRFPRNPYTTRASCGPAFRYSLASTLIRSKSARTASPAMIKYSIGMPNISPPITTPKSGTTENTKVHEGKASRLRVPSCPWWLFLPPSANPSHACLSRRARCRLLTELSAFSSGIVVARQFGPQADIRNALFVARNHHLSSLRDGAPILGSSTTGAASPGLRIDDFARSARANWNRDSAEHARHLVVGRIHFFSLGHENAREKHINDCSSCRSTQQSNAEAKSKPDCGIARKQISGAAEPGEKCREREQIETRGVDASETGFSAASVMSNSAVPDVASSSPMRKMRQMETAHQEREQAKDKSHGKTKEIKIRPCHTGLPCSARDVTDRAASGLSASSSRSASPGVSRIAPSNRKHRRVSLWRAALIRTPLTSGSLAKRSEPCKSHTSNFPSVVRKSEVSSVW